MYSQPVDLQRSLFSFYVQVCDSLASTKRRVAITFQEQTPVFYRTLLVFLLTKKKPTESQHSLHVRFSLALPHTRC
jgi:hypothetical protein